MDFPSIIAARRDGRRHTDEELRFLAFGAADGSIPDYQLSAWLMAAFLNPLDPAETAGLTLAMAGSGERIDLTGLPHPWVDKHSTGGVGDKTTLVLLPLLASCGLTVVKMSGRGLGITGGTIDKLESVPGFRTQLTLEELKGQAKSIGLAITGQSPNLAPADKVLYALRDVTETVSSIPLIVSSILSKKIAGGAEVIVLDVKCGSGAFMQTRESARALCDSLAETGRRCGLNLRLAISDMDQPLGRSVGNALEVQEALDILSGKPLSVPSARFRELCVHLAGLTLAAAEVSGDVADGQALAERSLANGDAAKKAAEWFIAQGASDPFEENFKFPQATHQADVVAERDGWVSKVDALAFGTIVMAMGGGRRKKDDEIDPRVGVELSVCVGSKVSIGTILCRIHASTPADLEIALNRVRGAIELSTQKIEPLPAFLESINV